MAIMRSSGDHYKISGDHLGKISGDRLVLPIIRACASQL